MYVHSGIEEHERIMPETRFTESLALSVDPRVGLLGLHRGPIIDIFLTYYYTIPSFISHFYYFLFFTVNI